jgi:hypothetical protein
MYVSATESFSQDAAFYPEYTMRTKGTWLARHSPGRAKARPYITTYHHRSHFALPRVPKAERWREAKSYRSALRRRSALAITETEERLMAALASMGLRSQPKNG